MKLSSSDKNRHGCTGSILNILLVLGLFFSAPAAPATPFEEVKASLLVLGYKSPDSLADYTIEDLADDYAKLLTSEDRTYFFEPKGPQSASVSVLMNNYRSFWKLARDIVKLVVPYDKTSHPVRLDQEPKMRTNLESLLDLDTVGGELIIGTRNLLELFKIMPEGLSPHQKKAALNLLDELYNVIAQRDIKTRELYLNHLRRLSSHSFLHQTVTKDEMEQVRERRHAREALFRLLGSSTLRTEVVVAKHPSAAPFFAECTDPESQALIPLVLAVSLLSPDANRHLKHLSESGRCDERSEAFFRSVYGRMSPLIWKLARTRRLLLLPTQHWSAGEILRLESAARSFPTDVSKKFSPHLVIKHNDTNAAFGYVLPYLRILGLGPAVNTSSIRHEITHIWDELDEVSLSQDWLALSGWRRVPIVGFESEDRPFWLPQRSNFFFLYGSLSPQEDVAVSMQDHSASIPEKFRALEQRGLHPRQTLQR
ncbi:MAG: hypothetical protein AB7G93_00045 [Bdellovibrionales bacterium]